MRDERTGEISYGYAATYAIHTDKAGNNPHAHILVANRRIDPKTGKWAAKRRTEYALDQNGERIPVIDPATGEQKTGAKCLCSMVLRPVERLVFSPKER